jgi:hypothetical protein
VRLVLERAPDDPAMPGVAIRVLALNDSYEPVQLDKRLLIGPNVVAGMPRPVAAEAGLPDEGDNMVVLQPWCFYGRQRSFEGVTGTATFHAYLLRADTGGDLGPEGPLDESQLLAAAEPLVLELG